ncbi:hypothetical protein BDV40DRAFT_306398 [Aspergillus tamarii]|uniref:FG-GAP repeat protein n=1 Tax=Aspergillus tamarii TaxID=41984 RepID=A0A5N6UC16_ASPTM|nr:hypothetical protein BDV40DRAFT_306398 [Aspergillus tamarii]
MIDLESINPDNNRGPGICLLPIADDNVVFKVSGLMRGEETNAFLLFQLFKERPSAGNYEGWAVKAWQNTGSLNKKGRDWQSLDTIAPGIGVTGKMIRFAEINGDGKRDFLAITDDGSISIWKNLGIVGAKDSSMPFADLDGDGHADMASIDAQGRARRWLNKGGNKRDDFGEIESGMAEGLSNSTIQFADVDSDKLDDFVVVCGGGAIKAYSNNGSTPDKGKDWILQPGIIMSEGVRDPAPKAQSTDPKERRDEKENVPFQMIESNKC